MTDETAQALFLRRAETFVPTAAALGPWSKSALHGGAVSALLAGQLSIPDRTLARLTVELLEPVPLAPLTLDIGEPSGGKRVQRQEAALSCDGRTVAIGRSVTIRQSDLQLPAAALAQSTPFDPAAAPKLDHPRSHAAAVVGWAYFDSMSVAVEVMPVPGVTGVHQWIRLLLPVVEGTPIRGVELAAVAADGAQLAAGYRLPYRDWTFLNSEVTMHLSREPVGQWVAIHSDAVVQKTGAGFNVAEIYDCCGRLGQSASAIVIQPRRHSPA
jgi:hypothetical protein